jgi:hypothetical protein
VRTSTEFRKSMLTVWRKAGPVYGDNVMPVLQAYKGLSAPEEKRAFQDALEGMLADNDPQVRSIAVTICLGFFVFRNVV